MLPSIKFRSLATSTQVNVPVTFGQVFAPGDLMAGRGLIARAADGSYLPLQVDQKATHADGSVRHAIISCILPALAAGETQSFQLLDADKRASVQTFAGAPAYVSATIGSIIYTAVLDLLNDKSIWLNGPVVIERQSAAPFVSAAGQIHPHLMARFAVRNYGSAKRVDVAIENNWAYEPGPQNFVYDYAITVAGQVVDSQTGLTHYNHARWRKVFWTGAAPQVNVQHDTAYLIATKAVPHYGPEVPAESVLQTLAAAAQRGGPMQIAAATAYMPTTGGRGDIGILPDWAWADIMSQDARARACTLVTGDGAGSFPMHYRDQVTDRPVCLKDHPRMTINGRSSDAGVDAFPAPGGDISSPYTPDISHHPSLAYLPYLITGDYYYLEELQFWAQWCMFSSNPGYRGAEQGLIQSEQLRGQAWALRTLAQAAYATPDDHPLKSEMIRVLDCNYAWYDGTYTNNPSANKIGVIANGYAIDYDDQTATATWMHDFFVQSYGHQIDLGFTKAKPLLQWLSKFTLGRMLEVSWTIGAPYGLPVRDTASSQIYDTIAQCYTRSLGTAFMALPWASPAMAAAWNTKGYPMNMYPSAGVFAGDMGNIAYGYEGYPSNMQPALSCLVDNDIPGAKQAWDNFMSRSVKCDYTFGGEFNTVPRDYIAQPVAPYVDTDTRVWQQIGKEGDTVTVPSDTTLRYGADGLYVEKVCSGSVIASNEFFGSDPVPTINKFLQKLIPSTEGNPMTTYKLSISAGAYVDQNLAFGTEAPTGLLIEVLALDGITVLGSTSAIPGEIAGLVFDDLNATYSINLKTVNSSGVMGAPSVQTFVPQSFLPAAPPAPTTQPFPILSGLTFTLVAEQ